MRDLLCGPSEKGSLYLTFLGSPKIHLSPAAFAITAIINLHQEYCLLFHLVGPLPGH